MDFPECIRVALSCYHAELFDNHLQLCNCKQYSTIIKIKYIITHNTVFKKKL